MIGIGTLLAATLATAPAPSMAAPAPAPLVQVQALGGPINPAGPGQSGRSPFGALNPRGPGQRRAARRFELEFNPPRPGFFGYGGGGGYGYGIPRCRYGTFGRPKVTPCIRPGWKAPSIRDRYWEHEDRLRAY